MPIRDAKRGPSLVFLFVIALLFVSTGCRVGVEEPQSSADSGLRSAMSASAAPLPSYSAAITAVDFDPPLKGEALLTPDQPIKLVAAVENRGTMQLSGVQVAARVASQRGDFSLEDQVNLDKLSPGETRVVEFRKVGSITTFPTASSYLILVSVQSPQLDPSLPRPSRELTVRVLPR